MSWCREKQGLPGTVTKFTFKSIHWITQMVANYAYSSYAAVGAAVKDELVRHEEAMFKAVEDTDKKIAESPDASMKIATEFSYQEAEKIHDRWTELYGELFMTYVDGYKTTVDPNEKYCGCRKQTLGWDLEDKAAIVARAGEKYHVPAENLGAQKSKFASINKFSLRAMGGKVHRGDCPDKEAKEEQVTLV